MLLFIRMCEFVINGGKSVLRLALGVFLCHVAKWGIRVSIKSIRQGPIRFNNVQFSL